MATLERESVEATAEAGKQSAARFPRERLERLAGLVPLAGDEGGVLVTRAPFTGETVGKFPSCGPATVRRAAQRARAVGTDWARRSFRQRAGIFLRFHDLILERQDEVLDLIQLESGKARKHAFEEVADVAMVARYYAHHAARHLAPRRRRGALPGLTATWEHRHPRGVVGFIAPWNYPLSLAVTDAIPALMAGNAVLLKPDCQTPFTALWSVELLQEAGLPLDLFQVVTGRGSEIGPALIEQVDFVSFTGSTETGRAVAGRAGERLIGCSLELGGKNSMIVLRDANLEGAVEGAIRGCFANAGQLCIATERLLVQQPLFDPFLRRFAERAAALKLGSDLDYSVDVGTLVSGEQLAKVEAHVRDAVEAGATVLAGGRARPDLGPFFYEPTILRDVTEEMRVYHEETFGPLVSVFPFEAVDEAVERANDTRYGLNASVWSADTDAAVRIATRLQAGTVNVNEAYAAAWASVDSPMGGFKDSGLGRRHGAEGIRKYTEPQTIAVQRLLPLAAPPAVGEEEYSQLLSRLLKIVRRLPGLR